MASEDITPRSIIQGFIEQSSVSKSAATTSRARLGRVNTGNRVASLRNDEANTNRRPRSVSDLTPHSLIQGVLQHSEVVQPPPRKRSRPSTPDGTRRRSQTPGTVPHSTAQRKMTRLETLATPGANPTPRSLIQGLIGTAPVETPDVHLSKSPTPESAEFPDVEATLQGRANSDQLSPLVPETQDTANRASRPHTSNLRKRQQISSADFAAGVRDRMSQKEEEDELDEVEEGDRDLYEEDSTGRAELEDIDGRFPDQDDEMEPDISEDEEDKQIDPEDEGEDEGEDEIIPEGEGEDEIIPEGEGEGEDMTEDATPQEDRDESHMIQDEGVEDDEIEDDPEEAEENQDENLEEPPADLALSPTPSSSGPADSSVQGSANKQAADSTWSDKDLKASSSSQIEGSPSGMKRLPDSTVGDSGSDAGETSVSDQPMDSESPLDGDADAQHTMAGSQSRLSGFSPLVTPRLPPGHSRPTPALKKTPAHRQQQTTQRNQAPAATSQPAAQKKKPPRAPRKDPPCLPTSLTKSILTHFSKARVSKDALEAVEKGAEVFFKRLSNDLTAYSYHGNRQTIEKADVELLMKRQGLIKDQQSMYALIEKYLPLEYRQELIPMASAGNKVTPKPST